MFGINGILGVHVQQLVELVIVPRRDPKNSKQEIMESNVKETILKTNIAKSKTVMVGSTCCTYMKISKSLSDLN